MPAGCGRMTRAAVARSRMLPLELAGLRIGWKVCLSMLAPARQREDAQLATVEKVPTGPCLSSTYFGISKCITFEDGLCAF